MICDREDPVWSDLTEGETEGGSSVTGVVKERGGGFEVEIYRGER